MSSNPQSSPVITLSKIIEDLKQALPHQDLKTQSMLKAKLATMQLKLMPVACKPVLTLQDVEDAQSITCYGLAYCCGLKRKCYWRDSARAALHIDDALYVQKEVVVWQLLAATNRTAKWIEDKAETKIQH